MGKLDLRCPNKHKLPHKTHRGACTPMYCMDDGSKPGKALKINKRKKEIHNKKTSFELKREAAIVKATKDLELEVAQSPIPIPDGASEMLVNEGRLESLARDSAALGRHRAKLSFIKGLPPEDADEKTNNDFADKRFNTLLPIAIAIKEHALRFGDDKQQNDAADTVLRATGRAQKDGFIGGGASIILNIGPGGLQLPYMPKHLKGEISEGEVVEPDAKK